MKRCISIFQKGRDFLLLRILALISLPFFALFCFFVLEYMNFGADLHRTMEFFSTRPPAVFGAIVMLTLFLLLLLLFRKAFIATGILGFFSLLVAYINYVKVLSNGDHFFPRDIGMVSNTPYLLSFISADLPGWYFLAVFTILLWTLFLWYTKAQLRLSWKFRLPSALLIALAVIFTFSSPTRTEEALGRFEMGLFSAHFQLTNYMQNGFVGAFSINIIAMNVERPADYSEENIIALLDDFTHTQANEPYFDVILVLSESFFDVRMLDVSFSENPLPNFDRLIETEGTVSGLTYVNALFGGTIRPEFEILSGLSTDFLPGGSIPYELLRRPMPTFVSHYRDFGYHTAAIHPFRSRFYNRDVAYPMLGFNEFLGYEHLAERFQLDYVGAFVSDESLIEPTTYFLDNTDDPLFLFIITMQGHQPFDPLSPDELHIEVTSDSLSPDTLETVTSFARDAHDADRFLGFLADTIDARERPTVLLFFGDHLPNLGANHVAFVESGLLANAEAAHTPEGRHMLFSTPFLIYANRPLNLGIFDDYTDNHISIYYLFPALALMTDFHRTPFMDLLLDHHARVPFHNERLMMEETDDILRLMHMHRLMTYDRLVGNLYSRNR